MANKEAFSYMDVLNHFGEEKVSERYNSIVEQMKAFILRKKYEGKVLVCASIVNQLVIDYFTDIYRLKVFHKIDLANYIKITAYLAYWILRRKPLQIIQDDVEDVELAFCNENFVLSYIMRFLQSSQKDAAVSDEDGKYKAFMTTLSYSLRYRTVTPQMFELMIDAFNGGRVFQDQYKK